MSTPRRTTLLLAALALLWTTGSLGANAQLQTGKPRVPPARDPGGLAIALISTGIDYTRKDIAERLARDGEGELIGLDLVDQDNKPFAAEPAGPATVTTVNGTELARQVLAAYRNSRLIPIRVAPGSSVHLGQALAFLASTPARIVAVPMWGGKAEDWEPFRQAASQLPNVLLILAAGDPELVARRQKQWPAALRLPNAVVVAPATEIAERSGALLPGSALGLDAVILPRGSSIFGQLPNAPPRNAGEAVALAAGIAACTQHRAEAGTAQTARRQLLAAADASRSVGGVPALDAICLYGGKRY